MFPLSSLLDWRLHGRTLPCLALVFTGTASAMPSLATQSSQEAGSREPVDPRSVARQIEKLEESDWGRRSAACFALTRFGPGALHALAQAHVAAARKNRDSLQSLVGAARTRIALENPEATPILLNQLASPEANIMVVAGLSLALAPDTALPGLIDALDHEEESVRHYAINALALHGRSAAAAIPKIIELLSADESTRVRWRAAWALGHFTPLTAPGITALENALDDAEPSVSALALWSLGRQGEAGWPGLLEALGKEALRNKASVRLALQGPSVARRLLERLNSETDVAVNTHCVRILGVVGLGDQDCADALLARAENSEEAIRIEALLALPALVDQREWVIELLGLALNSDSDSIRVAACEAAGAMGEDASALAMNIAEAWVRATKDGAASDSYAHALLRSKARSAALVEVLLDLNARNLDDPDTRIPLVLAGMSDLALAKLPEYLDPGASVRDRTAYCMLLGTLGPEARTLLLEQSRHDTAAVQSAALRALGRCGSDDDEVADRFREAWKRDHLRPAVVNALEWTEAGGESFRRKAFKELDEFSAPEQVTLVRAMGKWSPDSAGLVSKLSKLALESSSPPVRLAAISALGVGDKSHAKRKSTLRAVLEQRRSLPSELVTAALLGVGKLGDPDSKTIDLVIDCLAHPDRTTKVIAADTLEKIGKPASESCVLLGRRFQSRDSLVRAACLKACTAFGDEVEELTTTLGVALHQQDGSLAHEASLSLRNLGAEARLILPDLLYALLYDDLDVVNWRREDDGKALAPGAWEARRATEGFRETRVVMANLLGVIGASHPEDAVLIRPFLERTATDPDPAIAEASRTALAGF